MVKNATNSVKLSELMQQKEETQAALDEKMERWVYLNDLAEKIEAQKNGLSLDRKKYKWKIVVLAEIDK